MDQVQVIRPGLLVGLKSKVTGGPRYQRVDLAMDAEAETETESETERAEKTKYEVTRVTISPVEYKAAEQARGKARKLIEGCCINTAFGLLCPPEREKALGEAVAQAREICAVHNAGARYTHVTISVLPGRIATTDEEAVQSITVEMRGLLNDIDRSIDKLDAKQLRDTIAKAQEMAEMLAPEKAAVVTLAIQAARKAAREITKRVQKAGEPAAMVLESLDRRAISTARMSFLDLSEDEPVVGEPAMPSVCVQRFADLGDAGTV